MNWFRIPKESSLKPQKGKYYWHWKEDLSKEGKEQCVYCTININSFGGIRNFHVEHYRPKAEDKFPALKHEYSNLFFACSICNGFKGDDWPSDPSERLDNVSYPDPSIIDYSIFLYQNANYLVESKTVSGKYIIQKLFLNRPQLILERKSSQLHETLQNEYKKLIVILHRIQESDPTNPLIIGYIQAVETITLLIREKYINPYKESEIKR